MALKESNPPLPIQPPSVHPYVQQKPLAAAAALRKPRRNLTYAEKLLIIRKKDQEPSWTQENLALWSREHFKLTSKPTQATISNILRTRDKLQTTNVPPGYRSARPVKHPALDLAVIQWVLAMLASNSPLTRDAIQQRAITLAEDMEITTGITFSKGWVSSFMKRHQLHFRKKADGDTTAGDVDVQMVRQQPLEPASIGVYAHIVVPPAVVVQQTKPKRKRTPGNKNSAQAQQQEQQQVVALVPTQLDVNSSSSEPEQSVLVWLTAPGNYLRWRKTATAVAKGPLVGEINALLRTRNQRELMGVEVGIKIAALVDSFKAAHNWLETTGLHEIFNMERASGGNEVKPHVLKHCKHYEALAPVLSAYVDADKDAAKAKQAAAAELLKQQQLHQLQQQQLQQQQLEHQQKQQQQQLLQQQLIQQQVVLQQQQQQAQQQAQQAQQQQEQAQQQQQAQQAQQAQQQQQEQAQQQQQQQMSSPPQPKKQRRMSRTPDKGSSDKEEQQQQQLFDLECQKLQVDIQAKQVQLMVEKTLARKKLLDAGIPLAEVEKIFPM